MNVFNLFIGWVNPNAEHQTEQVPIVEPVGHDGNVLNARNPLVAEEIAVAHMLGASYEQWKERVEFVQVSRLRRRGL